MNKLLLSILLSTSIYSEAALPKKIHKQEAPIVAVSVEQQILNRLYTSHNIDSDTDCYYEARQYFYFVDPDKKSNYIFTKVLLTEAVPWFVPRKVDGITEVLNAINKPLSNGTLLVSDIKWVVVNKKGIDCLAIQANVAIAPKYAIVP